MTEDKVNMLIPPKNSLLEISVMKSDQKHHNYL